MPLKLNRLSHRLFAYIIACSLAIITIDLLSNSVVNRIPTTSSPLFPLLTIILMIFHITISCFMSMKYWCDKNRLYLMPIAFAFASSALLMLGTLSSYPGWLLCNSEYIVKQNDALIFYSFRNILMAVLFITAIIIYRFRQHLNQAAGAHAIILTVCFLFSAAILILSWLHSSNSPLLSIDFIDDITSTFTPLWHNWMGWLLFLAWVCTLILLIMLTRLRNIFWYSGAFFCAAYIFTLNVLLTATGSQHIIAWNQARLFETLSTLFMLFVLLSDVFLLYRDSNNKYINSYQNSIRDPLTGLYNRSYFYDTLNGLLPHTSATQPLSVIVSDLDHFKRINDNYGHVQGDKVIQFAASVLQTYVRREDIAARIGGEEFALLLVNTDADDALAIAERIRQMVSAGQDSLPEQMTISMGVYTATSSLIEAEECVKRADTAMYAAKNGGRNRVVVWQNK
ncbi:sensor domain-containing diguanylate cyclase [Klebsiella aerogenes]|uniref:sensor domain-containing diguanylate cyclase n=1 Tax=Klebsiella aerogenes TaxID=548 RepID=UPI0007D8A2E4|nr:GGDEF domain-containing protein [Klebsiella aerogenes]OAM79566.1 GGDEF domain-containing protein [Klebsiella aerogenes]